MYIFPGIKGVDSDLSALAGAPVWLQVIALTLVGIVLLATIWLVVLVAIALLY